MQHNKASVHLKVMHNHFIHLWDLIPISFISLYKSKKLHFAFRHIAFSVFCSLFSSLYHSDRLCEMRIIIILKISIHRTTYINGHFYFEMGMELYEYRTGAIKSTNCFAVCLDFSYFMLSAPLLHFPIAVRFEHLYVLFLFILRRTAFKCIVVLFSFP